MSKRLVVIDGKSVFYRGYYAMPNLSTKDGTPTGGVFGFATMALEIIKKLNPDYVCVAWDKPKTNIRSRLAIYPQYKAGRKPAPPDFYEQIPILHDLLDALGWPLYEADDYEADDLMGAFAKQAGEKDIESFLVTSDLDVLQLVNSHTHIYTLKKGFSQIELFNVDSFKAKYGVEPDQWIDVKALKGDSSDNIPGVGGVGEKTAIDLIKQYGNLEEVYENIELIKPVLKKKLDADREMAFMSKKLVTLMVDAPIKLDFEKAKLTDDITPEFVAILRKLEFKTLLRQAEARLSQTEKVEAEAPADVIAPAKQVTIGDLGQGDITVAAINPAGDTLWISKNPKTFAIFSLENKENIGKVLSGQIIGHDLKSLIKILYKDGLDWKGVVGHDTKIGAFLLDSLTRSRELSDLVGQAIDPEDSAKVIPAIWRAYEDQVVQFEQLPTISKLALEVEFPTIELLAKIEHRGIKLNSSYLNEMSVKFAQQISAFEEKIFELAGQSFNIASPSQLANILFDKLALPSAGIKKGKTGYSTGAKELDKLRGLNPIIDLITQYREYTKLKSTYIDSLPKLVDEEGKLHTDFRLDVAATGRLSSANPNLQNIPTRTEIGQAIRTAFVPAEGRVFVSADYSQFELRLAAVLADDHKMMQEFNNDIDIHAATAAEVYNVDITRVTKDQRRNAKTINFGVLYGMSPHGLSVGTGMSLVEARDFIRRYFELRAPVRVYMDDVIQQAIKDDFVQTMFGRRRPTPDLKSSNFAVREAARRAAINMPIQGTEADLMKMAMLKVESELGNLGDQLLQIHDSILVECDVKNVAKVKKILKEVMENISPELPVKLKVDVKSGANWGEI